MDETPTRLAYNEPTVMWRMRRAGQMSHAVMGPCADGTIVVMWFINGRPLGYRDFSDWTNALRWSDQMQAQNWAVGWRIASPLDETTELHRT